MLRVVYDCGSMSSFRKLWLDHVWIVDFEQVEVILQESEWKRFFPEEWLNNGEEDCNGKKE